MAFSFYAVIPPQRQQTRAIQSFTDCLMLGWHRVLLQGSLAPNQTVAWGVKISKEIHNTLLPECKTTLSYHYSNMEPYILAIYSHHFPSATQNAIRTSIQRGCKGKQSVCVQMAQCSASPVQYNTVMPCQGTTATQTINWGKHLHSANTQKFWSCTSGWKWQNKHSKCSSIIGWISHSEDEMGNRKRKRQTAYSNRKCKDNKPQK